MLHRTAPPTSRVRIWGLVVPAWILAVSAADARVVRVEIGRRVEVLGGKSFGSHGAYELIEGRIYFAFDPGNPANDRIVDLDLAPRLGPVYPSLVAPVDSLGNERAGIRTLETRVPLATYMPWNLRIGAARNADELTNFFGSVVPLPATPAEKQETGDPRPAATTLYSDKAAYMKQARAAADAMIEEGVLLSADRVRVVRRAEAIWGWVAEE